MSTPATFDFKAVWAARLWCKNPILTVKLHRDFSIWQCVCEAPRSRASVSWPTASRGASTPPATTARPRAAAWSRPPRPTTTSSCWTMSGKASARRCTSGWVSTTWSRRAGGWINRAAACASRTGRLMSPSSRTAAAHRTAPSSTSLQTASGSTRAAAKRGRRCASSTSSESWGWWWWVPSCSAGQESKHAGNHQNNANNMQVICMTSFTSMLGGLKYGLS